MQTIRSLATQALVILALLAGLLYWHEADKKAALSDLSSSYEAMAVQQEKAAQRASEALAGALLQAQKDKEDEIAVLQLAVDDLSHRLSTRPSRPSVPSVITETIHSCTGAQLYKEDGLFLAGEAARADNIRIERDFYYGRYEDARLQLEQLKEQNGN